MTRSAFAGWIATLALGAAGVAFAQSNAKEEPAPGVSAPPPAVAPAAPAPPAAAPAEATGEYVVKAGDTLMSIAERLTGSEDNWVALARANGIEDPSKLAVGLRLKIPADLRST